MARYLELAPGASDTDLIRARIRALQRSVDERELVRSEPARGQPPVAVPSVL